MIKLYLLLDELESFFSIIEKITDNITSHPEEIKYQKLKFSNRIVTDKINNRPGGMDFMLAMGFDIEVERSNSDKAGTLDGRRTGEDGELGGKYYILQSNRIESINSSLIWLG